MTNITSSNTFATRLETLRISYRKRLKNELEQLSLQVKSFTGNTPNKDDLQTLHNCFHKLAGSAGTFGFDLLGRQAKEYEQQVVETLKSVDTIEQLPLAEWIEQLQKILHEDENRKAALGMQINQTSKMESEPRIWLIERDAILAEFTVQQLSSFGFEVTHLSDALDLAKHQGPPPELLLVDHRASHSEALKDDPVDFWQSVLKAFTCPIFFIGAEESFSARLNALRSGGQGYFVKPLDMIKLTTHMVQLIRTENTDPERIMIVEDDMELARHIQSILEHAGMQVFVLNQPQELFKAVSDFNPELILMDLWLPEVSGAELASLLGQVERWTHLPIVYLSAESNADLRSQALLMGGDAFLEKPLDMELVVRLCQTRVQRLRQLEQTRNRDSLTGLLKHGSIKLALQIHWEHVLRQPQIFSVVMLDIDHFKIVNDTHGHAVGDLVIAAVGTLLLRRFRSTDKLGRYGGEEFTLVLTDCSAENALRMVEDLREAFAAIKFTASGEQFSCTLSAGISDNQRFPNAAPDELIDRADKALYQAKNSGRNRVCIATD